jgi:hypothetical protein
MERRKFIKRTAAAITATALIGFPELISAQPSLQDVEDIDIYKSNLQDGHLMYKLKFFHEIVTNFDDRLGDWRKLTLKIDDNSDKNNISISKGKYMVYKIKKIKVNEYQVYAKLVESVVNYEKLPSQFKKKFSFKIFIKDYYTDNYIELYSKAEKTTKKLSYHVAHQQGCYLTTACTVSKDLADDCYELTTLRRFRDNFMLKTIDGQKSIKSYYHKAPNLVNRINSCKNSKEIYDYIYDNLVTKSIDLIEKNKLEEAFNHYKNFVVNLDKVMS